LANAIYPLFKQELIKGTAGTNLNGSGTTGVYVALVDTGTYTYSASHQYYSSISSGVVGTPVELASKTFVNGLFDAADSTFTAVSGSSAEATVFYIKNAGANTTWPLVAYIDTGATGLPVTPNGGDITVTYNASGIIQF
jgi:hypothetical protein